MNSSELKSFLDEKVLQYNTLEFIESDPVQIPHLFSQKEDIEIAGFLAATILDERPIPLTIFGFAIIKGALSAKFLLISEAVFPIKVIKAKGLIRSLLLQSLIYVGIVLCLNYVEAGVDGLIHGKSFWDSLMGFGQANPLRVLAMCIVYWLIVWPYLVLIGLKISLGSTATIAILFGDRAKSDETTPNT